MCEISYYIYKSPFGRIVISSDGNAITGIKLQKNAAPIGIKQSSPLTDLAAVQLKEYFAGARMEFDLPLNPKGTDFQCAVWKALLEIPHGKTQTYKQVAEAIGTPKASRAVGTANNKNPIWIVIPCHRIIGANGSLIGYGGGLEMKRRLLEIEGIHDF